MTFKEKYLAGEVGFDEIHDCIDRWGCDDITISLREYLGLNAEEEDVWIEESDEALQALLDRQKQEG